MRWEGDHDWSLGKYLKRGLSGGIILKVAAETGKIWKAWKRTPGSLAEFLAWYRVPFGFKSEATQPLQHFRCVCSYLHVKMFTRRVQSVHDDTQYTVS